MLLGQIVEKLGGQCFGPATFEITGIASLEAALPGQISFLSNAKFKHLLPGTQAGCVIVGTELAQAAQERGFCIVADDPYVYFARLTQLWRRSVNGPIVGVVHPSAVVHADALVDSSAVIGPLCVVERGARIGAATVLKARVTVGENCVVGSRCVLHSGVVIGADGFGFAPYAGRWEKIEQLGAVTIGDDVEIGANTCIDRGALENTVVGDGVKLDNLIQIGHNVQIGNHTAMAGCVGVAGSAKIGAHCTVGGGAVILGHLAIADHVHISAASVVTRSLPKPGHYTGLFPIDDNAVWEKNAASLKQLSALRDRLRSLENKLNSTKKP